MGSDTSGSELSGLFTVLPTRKDYPGGYKANQVYIRGHLLNANLGGQSENRNLFPITQKANSDHHNMIEKKAKELVNDKGFLVRYEVEVKSRKSGQKNGFSYINSVFDCNLATYTLKNGELLPNKKVLKAKIISNFEADGDSTSKGTIDENGLKQKNFDASKVNKADGKNVAYLSDMSAAELKSISGVSITKARQIIKDRGFNSEVQRRKFQFLQMIFSLPGMVFESRVPF
nr:DNA/RNA non-specific endonuclease [sulfur-oxidizing endosymbiont of Gigantopelta aegis]